MLEPCLLQPCFHVAGIREGVLEYGVRAPAPCGKSTGANGRKRFSTNMYRKLVLFLRRSPKISGNFREFTGECNLSILYSSSLLLVVSSNAKPVTAVNMTLPSLRVFCCCFCESWYLAPWAPSPPGKRVRLGAAPPERLPGAAGENELLIIIIISNITIDSIDYQ